MKRDDWETPQKLFNYLNNLFDFRLDAAADEKNAKCVRFFSEEDNALNQSWGGYGSVFCNPPYSLAGEFARKAFITTMLGSVCMLLPVRSDRLWFQQILNNGQVKVSWITGRLHFGESGKAAFMYSVLFYRHKSIVLPQHMQAGQFNDNGKGDAKS